MSTEITEVDVGGRPTKYDELLVKKLEAAFNNGFNIKEACQYGEISRETYYNWLETVPGFSDRMELAKMAISKKAKEVVVQDINAGSAQSAWKWLQLRDPDFKPKGEMDINHGLQETRDKIKGFLDDTNDGAYDDVAPDVASTEHPAADQPGDSAEVPATTPDIS